MASRNSSAYFSRFEHLNMSRP